jgi:hypothetical protein
VVSCVELNFLSGSPIAPDNLQAVVTAILPPAKEKKKEFLSPSTSYSVAGKVPRINHLREVTFTLRLLYPRLLSTP